jgi:hypothetical protein
MPYILHEGAKIVSHGQPKQLSPEINIMAATFSLGSVAALLDEQARSFSDVYKLYGFREDQSFSEYVDFFLHEPVAWFEGLPASLKSKASFTKPKTAFSKALKHGDVIAALGAETCENAVRVLWDTYKKEADRIVASRNGTGAVVEEGAAAAIAAEPILEVTEEEPGKRRSRKQKAKAADATTTGATGAAVAAVAAVPNPSTMSYETKYRVIDRAFRALLSDGFPASEATLVFLDALHEA